MLSCVRFVALAELMIARPFEVRPLGEVPPVYVSERLMFAATPKDDRRRRPRPRVASAKVFPTTLNVVCQFRSSSAPGKGFVAGQVTGESRRQLPSSNRGPTRGLNQSALITAPLVRPLSVT